MSSQNFNDRANTFSKNIYNTRKGKIRIEVLLKDLAEFTSMTSRPLRILDAGGGFGYLSQKLASMGHEVVLCDISDVLLEKARQQIAASSEPLAITLIHCPIEKLPKDLGQFDLILCHAVLEWLEHAEATLNHLRYFLKPDGLMSVMYFNLDALRYHALVNGNFDYLDRGLKAKKRVKLSPNFPLTLQQVSSWFQQWDMPIMNHSAVRFASDYLRRELQESEEQNLIDYELAHCRNPNYLGVARYIHTMVKAA